MKCYVIYEEYGKLDKRHQEFLSSHSEVWGALYTDLDECIDAVKEYSKNEYTKLGQKVLQVSWNDDKKMMTLYLGYSKAIKLHIIEVNSTSKEGKWLFSLADNGWANWSCSNCNLTFNDDIDTKYDYQYCPNCGIKMQNGKKHNVKQVIIGRG